MSFVMACHSMEVIVPAKDTARRSATITIGRIEHRTTGYNPYTADLLRDALRFEFFRLGYAVDLTPAEKKGTPPVQQPGTDKGDGPEIRSAVRESIMLTGTVFETSYGDALQSNSSSHIRLSISGSGGAVIGEARYTLPDALSDAEVISGIARRLAGDIHAKIAGR